MIVLDSFLWTDLFCNIHDIIFNAGDTYILNGKHGMKKLTKMELTK